MKYPTPQTMLLSGVILALLIYILVARGCDSTTDQDVISAVAQNQIENLQANVVDLENQNTGYHAVQDSLLKFNRALSSLLVKERKKYAVIEAKYSEEKQRIKELPNDSAAALFLDRADCSEFPVMLYDSTYLIPIEPIRFYNLLAVDFDQAKETNIVQKKELIIQAVQINSLIKISDNKSDQIIALNKLVDTHKLVIAEKDKQLAATQKKMKVQKLYHFGLVAVALAVGIAL